MKKKKKKTGFIILIIFFLIVLINLYTKNRILTNPEKFIKNILFIPLNITTLNKDIELDYDNLKSLNEDLTKENNELKEMLELEKSDPSYINASVTTRNINYFFDTLTLNKGTSDNVKLGSAVVTPKGFIGFISEVTNNNSVVSLITNEKYLNMISVSINDSIYGLMSGYDKINNELIISNITSPIEIKENDIVKTAYSDTYQSGLYIGKVVSIKKDNFDLEKELRVKSEINFNDIRYVMVISK